MAHDNEWVDTLRSSDVLFGRGSGPNDHEGNILFRSLVKQRKSEYMATNHRQTKARIAQEIVDNIRAKNGRFLKKADAKDMNRLNIPEGVEAWCRVDERTILEKAKQALRQKQETKDRDDDDVGGSFPDEQVSSSAGISNVPYQPPLETVARYPPPQQHPMGPPVMPDVYVSDEMQVSGSQEPLDWRTFSGNQDPMQAYMPTSPSQQAQYAQQGPVGHPSQSFLPEESPPVQRYSDHSPQRMDEMHHERLSEQNIHRAAAAGYAGEQVLVGDGPEDDGRRKSLQVEDLMRTFHRMGTDEMATSSSSNAQKESSSSNETMGTIDPLPMGASDVSMMSSSTFSVLKGALESPTPRGSLTRPSRAARETSNSSGSRDARSVSSDMSLSFSHIDAAFDSSSGAGSRLGNQFSQVVEGNESEEQASDQKLTEEPRPVYLMEEDPDSMSRFGQSSMNILKATLGDSGDTMGSSSGKMEKSGESSLGAPRKDAEP